MRNRSRGKLIAILPTPSRPHYRASVPTSRSLILSRNSLTSRACVIVTRWPAPGIVACTDR